MVHAAEINELRAVEAVLLLRTLGLEGEVVVVVHARGIAPARRRALAPSAVGEQTEAAAHLRPHAGQVEAGADDLRVFQFVDLGRTGLSVRGLDRTRGRQVARVAEFVAVRVEADGAVARQQLAVELEVLVTQNREIGNDECRCERHHAGCDGRVVHLRLPLRDLVVGARTPEPEVIPPDRSTDLGAVVAQVVDPIGANQIAGGFPRHLGLGRQAFRRVEVAARTLEVVRATLGDHVQLHARRLNARVGAAGGDLHLFERVEVVVGRRGTGGAHVGDVHAVDVPRVVASQRALGDVVRLLAALGAAHVDAVDHHRGNRLQNRPRIPRSWNLLQLHLRNAGTGAGLADVEQRRFRSDGDRFRHRRVEGQGDVGVLRHADADAGASRASVSRQLSLDGVRARREIDEAEVALCVGDGGLWCANAGQGDRHAGKDAAVLRLRLAVDVSGLILRVRADGQQRHAQRGGENRQNPGSGSSPHLRTPFVQCSTLDRELESRPSRTAAPDSYNLHTCRMVLGPCRMSAGMPHPAIFNAIMGLCHFTST